MTVNRKGEPKRIQTADMSDAMREALAMVPETWGTVREFFHLQSRRGLVRHPLVDRTFKALQRRKLIEIRGRPGAWDWRRCATAITRTRETTTTEKGGEANG